MSNINIIAQLYIMDSKNILNMTMDSQQKLAEYIRLEFISTT